MLTRADISAVHLAYVAMRKQAGLSKKALLPTILAAGAGKGLKAGQMALAEGAKSAILHPGRALAIAGITGLGAYGAYRVARGMKRGATGEDMYSQYHMPPPNQGVY